MQEKIFLVNKSGQKLAALVDRDENREKQDIIVFVNGFGGVKDSKGREILKKFFTDLGFATLRMDNRGKGESEGTTVDYTVEEGVKDVSIFLDALKTLSWVDKISLFGSSNGGGVSVAVASRFPEDFNFLILSSPSVDNKEMYEYAGEIDIEKWKIDKVAEMYGSIRGYELYSEKINLYKEAENINCPTFIIHGDLDKSVPISQSKKINRSIKNSTFVTLKGYGHHYKDFEQPFELINAWLFANKLISF